MSTNLAKTTALSPLAEKALLAAAAAIGLFFLIRGGLTLMEPSRAYKPNLNTAPSITSSTDRGGNRAAIDPSFDPFHRLIDESIGIQTRTVIGEDAPETDLNITLKGRRASGDGSGSAILRLPDGQEKTVAQGGEIIKNVTLDAIYPTHIIISRKGTQERLTFERAAGLIISAPQETTPKSSPSKPQAAARNSEPNVSPTTSRPAVLNPADLRQQFPARRAQKGNTKAFTIGDRDLLSSLRPTPVREDGRFIGYRIRSTAGAERLSDFGFQTSDIITQIDGQNVPENISELSTLFKRLSKDASGSTFTVQRDGQPLTLSINN